MSDPLYVVTGASKGIGAAIARELAARGLSVVCLSRTGGTPAGQGVVCDMADEQQVKETFGLIAKVGPIAGLVNNAGLQRTTASAKLETGEYERVMHLNATSLMVACREAYPYLKAYGAGRIVNIGSFFDKLGVSGNLAYCASKAAVGAITRCLAVEWAVDGILVNNVAPGYIETDLNRDFVNRDKVKSWLGGRIPVGRIGQPNEVAQVVAALMTGSMTFLNGETIYVDGGHGINH
ncbi:MAG: SDR family oxidoreductase [Betaproteobacteria bacterium]|jgi:NAD(P)-dependent dehydrogenase (short-subunit alcohol dehydrogenase family)|nr:MAG: SDR family oxidoreductase [Betaproteobacteria bacterium]